MSLRLLVVLAAAQLEDRDLVAAAVRHHGGLDLGARDQRRAVAAVDALIRRRLDSDVVLVRQVAEYIIASGGKRLRPVLLLLAAGACGYRGPAPP